MSRPQANTPPVVIESKGLSKSYGTRWALREVDLEVAAGESLAVFGANGAGKSTLIRLLATLTPPSLGTLQIAGRDGVRSPRSVRGAIGVLSHQSYLYAELTAAENLALYARLYGVGDATRRVDQALASVGLQEATGRRVRELSRGMQQRLALARATLHRPLVLLLDEPESGLDADGILCLTALLARGRDEGQAVVMTTHRVELGLALCDRALVLAQGRVARCASSRAYSAESWHALYAQTSYERDLRTDEARKPKDESQIA